MRVVILGAGPAGVTVAERVRRLDPEAEISLVSAEPFPPYSPPAMADHFLRHRSTVGAPEGGTEEPLFWKGRDFCSRLGLDYRSPARVRSVDVANRRVQLADSEGLEWDRLVIATGARLFVPLEGRELEGIFDFKSLGAAEELVNEVRKGEVANVVIVGAGFIGVEVALLLCDLGLQVTLLERFDRVMPQMLDLETAQIVAEALGRRGVDLRLRTEALAFLSSRRCKGRVGALELVSGETLVADVFVAASGVQPNVDFLADSTLDVGWGIPVDESLRTSVEHIYAAGDVAETRDRLTGERSVHAIFPNAVVQAEIVAANLLGHDLRYEGSETMNSLKHLGVPVVAAGAVNGEEVLRWRCGDRLRQLVVDDDDRLIGFRLAGDIRQAGVLRALMLRGDPVTRWKGRLLGGEIRAAELGGLMQVA